MSIDYTRDAFGASGYKDLVKSCTANYVRKTLLDPQKRQWVDECLKEGRPMVREEFGAVAMIDISGYSSLTSRLATLGKVGSEIVTTTVGNFLDKVICALFQSKGDVVKFLGDAMLVCFSPESSEPEAIEANLLRALRCCLHIALNYNSIVVDLSKAITERNLILGNKPKTNGELDWIEDLTTVRLHIHVALTSGDLKHVISGLYDKRLDYFVHSPCLEILGEILDHTHSGELGVSRVLLEGLKTTSFADTIRVMTTKNESFVVFSKLALTTVLQACSENASPIFTSNDTLQAEQEEDVSIEPQALHMLELFVNPSLLHRFKAMEEVSRFTTVNIQSLQSTRRSQLTASNTETPETTTVNRQSEFRVVTVIFVKFESILSPKVAHNALSGFLTILANYEGVFQQFSFDDKGQTMLACFGLPPWTHQKDEFRALKAAVEFEMFVSQQPQIKGVKVSVATGDLLFSKLGNDQRSDASLLGDVVNIAARLLGIKCTTSSVLCDKTTFLKAKEDFIFSALGGQKLKGKEDLVEVWAVHSNHANVIQFQKGSQQQSFVGYVQERAYISEAFYSWFSTGAVQKILVEGDSGKGKSKIVTFVTQEAQEKGINVSITQGNEIHQNMPYDGIRPLVSYIFKAHSTFFIGKTLGSKAQSMTSCGGGTATPTRRSQRNSVTNYFLAVKESTARSEWHFQTVVNFLNQMGEDATLAPLMADVLPYLNIPETETTSKLDASMRMNAIKNLVVRLVTKSLSLERFLVVIDDCQWIDTVSIEIMKIILRTCPNLMMVIFSRPVAATHPLAKLVAECEPVVLKLNGFTDKEAVEMLLEKWSEFGVKKIHPDTVTELMEKGGRFPLVLDMMAETIKTEFSKMITLSSSGEASFTFVDGKVDLGRLTTVSSSVISQFDRLNPQFQTILLKASIFGQYFTLGDLTSVGGFISSEEVQKIIAEHDLHSYLIMQEGEDPDDNESVSYYFRHIQIMQAIYDMQSFSDRSASHLKAALYYENLLNSAGTAILRESLLPTVIFHFRRTTAFDKQIEYIEELALILFERDHRPECKEYLETLVEMVDNGSVTPKNVPDLTDLRQSRWVGLLATVVVTLSAPCKEHYDLCKRALKLAGKPWPETDKDCIKEIFKVSISLWKLWKQTNGGRKPMLLPTNSRGRRNTIHIETIDNLGNDRFELPNVIERRGSKIVYERNPTAQKTMSCVYHTIFRICIFSDVAGPLHALLSVLKQLIVQIIYSYREKQTWVWTLYLASAALSSAIPRLSAAYFDTATSLEEEIERDNGPRDQIVKFFHYKSVLLIVRSRLDEATDGFFRQFHASREAGDMMAQNISLTNIKYIEHLKGSIFTYNDLVEKASEDRDDFQKFLFYSLALSNLLNGNLEKAQPLLQRCRDIANSESPHAMFIGAMTSASGIEAFLRGNWREMHSVLLKGLDVFSKVNNSNTIQFLNMALASFVLWMYVGLLEDGVAQRDPKTAHTHYVELQKALQPVVAMSSQMLSKGFSILFWPHQLFSVCHSMILDKMEEYEKPNVLTLIMRKSMRPSVSSLPLLLGKASHAKLLDMQSTMRVAVYTILGIYLVKPKMARLRHYYRNRALQEAKERGLTLFEIWMSKCS
ncbi:hypothetical protein HDV05_005202 [Chytridiales sp. JEL 0842]|nr:hypothetical protein HDV05_005202 [Chytridiales sp. JEL 0842]